MGRILKLLKLENIYVGCDFIAENLKQHSLNPVKILVLLFLRSSLCCKFVLFFLAYPCVFSFWTIFTHPMTQFVALQISLHRSVDHCCVQHALVSRHSVDNGTVHGCVILPWFPDTALTLQHCICMIYTTRLRCAAIQISSGDTMGGAPP